MVLLIYTGAVCTILLFKIFDSLPASAKFTLSSVTQSDGQQAKTHGVGLVVVYLGT